MNKFIVLCIALSMVAMTQQASVTLGTALEVASGANLVPSAPVLMGTGALGQSFALQTQDSSTYAAAVQLLSAANAKVGASEAVGFTQEAGAYVGVCRVSDTKYAGVAAAEKGAGAGKKLMYQLYTVADGAKSGAAAEAATIPDSKIVTKLTCLNNKATTLWSFDNDAAPTTIAFFGATPTLRAAAATSGAKPATQVLFTSGDVVGVYYLLAADDAKKQQLAKAADGVLDTAAAGTAPTAATALFTSGTQATFNSVKVTWTFTANSGTAAKVTVAEGAATAVEVAPATAKYVTLTQVATDKVCVTYWSADKVYTRLVTVGAAAATTTNSFKLGGNFMMMIMMIVMLNMI